MKKQWMLKRSGVNIKKLAYEAGTSELIACILANRDIKDPKEIKGFLSASLTELHDGTLMKDMIKGSNIIKQAILERKKIIIYGDYDADGVISTYILFKALKECGAIVHYHIPDRESEGYGMNLDRVKSLRDEGFEVILTCDNGIAAIEQIAYAKEIGFTVVITDHHDVQYVEEDGTKRFIIPDADAIINPKQEECSYPFKLLCGGGIAFKFSEALFNLFGFDSNKAVEYIEYAAIATVCDVVDLIGENRIIAKNGLNMLNMTKNIGIKALLKQTGLELKTLGAYHLGFVIGPCINATGRLEHAKLSVELLLSESEEEAVKLAAKLHELNTERQELTNKGVEEVLAYIENNSMENDKVIVVYNKNIHESIAGIVAGRIKEKYNVPTIVLTKGKEMLKGSARSIEAYNMFEELLECKHLLSKFGGHPMAAGLSIEEDKLNELRSALLNNCKLSNEDVIPKVRIDTQLSLSDLNYNLIDDLSVLEPFGKGNPSPLFAEKGIQVFKADFLGKDKNVLKLSCGVNGSNKRIFGISFEHCDEFKEYIGSIYGEEFMDKLSNGKGAVVPLDLIFYPQINEYNGNISMQIIIKEIRM